MLIILHFFIQNQKNSKYIKEIFKNFINNKNIYKFALLYNVNYVIKKI